MLPHAGLTPGKDDFASAFLPVAATAAGAFVVTNLDDIVVLTALFSTSGLGGPSRRKIVVGQYLGLGFLFAASAVAALGLLVVPERWIGLLGVVPIALGVRGLLAARRTRGPEAPMPSAVPVRGIAGVAAVTIANGADNISVYVPLLRQAGVSGLIIYGIVFAMLVGVWCLAALGLPRVTGRSRP